MRIAVAIDGTDGEKALMLPVLLEEVVEEYSITIMGDTESPETEPILILIDVEDRYEPEVKKALNILFGEPEVIMMDLDLGDIVNVMRVRFGFGDN